MRTFSSSRQTIDAKMFGKTPEELRRVCNEWRDFFRRKRWKAAGIVCVLGLLMIVVTGVLTGLYSWIGNGVQAAIAYGCKYAKVPFCADGELNEGPFKVVFSMSVSYCAPGRLVFKLRDYVPPIRWENGADRLVICGNAEAPASPETYIEVMQSLVPDCLSANRDADQVVIATDLNSGAVCRAPYRFDGSRSSLAQGVFICTPGHRHDKTDVGFPMGDKMIPECHENVLQDYGFLP